METALGESGTTNLGRISAAQAARWILFVSLIAGTAARLWLGLHDDGIFWADEVYQSLEPAHRLVFGYGKVAWEFDEGARNWTYPALIAATIKLGSWLGPEPASYLTALRILACAVAAATAGGVYYLARSLHTSALSAAVASSIFMLAEPLIYFGHRAISETACALPIVWAFACLLARAPERRRPLLGAALLVLACLLRLQAGIFCLAIVSVYWLRGEKRDLLRVLAVFALGAALYGMIDRLTWGGWFHSAIAYFRFNVIEEKAAHWGLSPFYFYARVLATSMFGVSLLLGVLAVLGARREPALAASAGAFFLVHCAIGHKEYRFILPVIPLFCALAAVGLDAVSVPRRKLVTSIALLTALASLARFPSLELGQLGREDTAADESAYDRFGPVNRLLLQAHARTDLCGLKVRAVPWWNLGGYSYLHRRVPLYAKGEGKSGAYNYVITSDQVARGEVVASDSGEQLIRVGPSCVPDRKWKY